MALDQQRNWTISMAENLRKIQSKAKESDLTAQDDGLLKQHKEVMILRPFQGPPIHLPDEIIIAIVEYTRLEPDAQKTLASCCLLSHQWYSAAIEYLYEEPKLYGRNFDPFIRTICPSINLHVRKSPLSSLVKDLDLGRLVHNGSKSITARLLGRTKASLEAFRAPQASFAINCLPALARCARLRSLDLSLVSESPQLPALLRAVAHLGELRTLKLPRSSGFGNIDRPLPLVWPSKLEEIALSGGIDAWFLAGDAKFPESLRSLVIEHCPMAKSSLIIDFLVGSIRKLPVLESLRISNMPRFDAHAMDDLLHILPNLRHLSISVDYISPNIFEEGSPRRFVLNNALQQENKTILPRLRHDKLYSLELTNSGNPSVEDKITPIDLLIAVDDDILPALRVVRVVKSLYWQSGEFAKDAEALADALQARNTADWESRVGRYEKMSNEQWQKTDPARTAGVWTFDG